MKIIYNVVRICAKVDSSIMHSIKSKNIKLTILSNYSKNTLWKHGTQGRRGGTH